MNSFYQIINEDKIPSKKETKIIIDNILNDLKNEFGKDINIELFDFYEYISKDDIFFEKEFRKYLFNISNGIYYETEFLNDKKIPEHIELFYKNFNSYFWYELLFTLFHEYYHALSYNKDRNNNFIYKEDFIYLMERKITGIISIRDEIIFGYKQNNMYSELQANKYASDKLCEFLEVNNITKFISYANSQKELNNFLLERFDVRKYINYFTTSRVKKIISHVSDINWMNNFWNKDGSVKDIIDIYNNKNIDLELKYLFLSSDNYINSILNNKKKLSLEEKLIFNDAINYSIMELNNRKKNLISPKEIRNNEKDIRIKKKKLSKI